MFRRSALIVGLLVTLAGLSLARGVAPVARAQTPPTGSRPAPRRTATPPSGVPAVLANNPHFQAQQAFNLQRLQGLSGESYNQALAHAAAQRRALPSSKVVSTNGIWSNLGPNPISNVAGGEGTGAPERVTGRIESIAVAPGTNNQTAYVAPADGGIWKTTNGGTTWTPLTDQLTLTPAGGGSPTTVSLAFGALAIDPSNASIIYAGTGEESFAQDGLGGVGLLKSADGGATWYLMAGVSAFANGNQNYDSFGLTFSHIVVDPTSATTCGGYCRIYAATSEGLYRSNDGGLTWTHVAGDANQQATDVVLNSTVPSGHAATVYAGLTNSFGGGGDSSNGIYISTNLGAFTLAGGGLPVDNNSTVFVGRVALAVDPQTPTTVYAAIGDGTSDQTRGGDLLGVYKSTDGGSTWSLAETSGTHNCDNQSTSGPCNDGLMQTWYALDMAVDPTTHNVLLGTTDIWESTDGGSWTDVSQINAQGPHVDQHALTFSGGTVWSGSDGGVWSSTNDGASWSDLNQGGLITNQFYQGGSVSPLDPSIVFGGLQDNGSVFMQSSSAAVPWTSIDGGDGFSTAIDPRSANGPWYAEYSHLGGLTQIMNPTSGTPSYNPITTGLNASGAGFVAPFILDPSHPTHLIAGAAAVSLTTNANAASPTWTQISQSLPVVGDAFGSFYGVTALAVDSGDTTGNTIYAGVGDGGVWETTTGATPATWTSIKNNLPTDRPITSITTDGSSSPTVYVTTSGFGAFHVAKLPFGATTWIDLSGNLPAAPADVIKVINGTLYLGTDIGAFTATDAGASTNWSVLGANLPFVQVTDLLWQSGTSTLIALTHGRGAWSYGIAPAPCGKPSFSASPATTAGVGTTVNLTAVATVCTGPQYEYWLLPPGSSNWQILTSPTCIQLSAATETGSYSTDGTPAWNTDRNPCSSPVVNELFPAGTYTLAVWDRAMGSTLPYDSSTSFTYTLTAPTCTGATLSASLASPLPLPVSVTFTAQGTPSAGTACQYEFWGLPYGGSWVTAQSYSTTNTWNWNVGAGTLQGFYQIAVWAKATGSTQAYDSFAIVPETLGCAVTLSANPAGPANGQNVTFTATPSGVGCASAQYEWWALPPGGGWGVGVVYSGASTLTVSSVGVTAGTWEVAVWEKSPLLGAAYDTYAIIPYVFNGTGGVAAPGRLTPPPASGTTPRLPQGAGYPRILPNP